MRGRWAMATVGAGVARRRASGEMEQERQAHESQQRSSTKTNRSATTTDRSTTRTTTTEA